MSDYPQPNAIYFREGAGYLLVKVLQTVFDSDTIETNVMLVKSLEDNKLYVRKELDVSEHSWSGIPNEIEFNTSFSLIPRVKNITRYKHLGSDFYWVTTTEYCNGGDLRGLFKLYGGDSFPEVLIYKFMADMIKILGHLSEKKILHKDIYPQNIFLRYSDDDPSDCLLPDFLLGDFGWAGPLKDKNRGEDIMLFIQCVWDMFGPGEDEVFEYDSDVNPGLEELDSGALEEGTHCASCLQTLVSTLMVSAEEGLLTVDYLVTNVLPVIETKVCQLRTQTALRRHLPELTAASRDNRGHQWPEKLRRLRDDWRLVNIVVPTNTSDNITIRCPGGLSNGGRMVKPFTRYASNCLELDFVYRFDANGRNRPPILVESDGVFKGMTLEEGLKRMFKKEIEN